MRFKIVSRLIAAAFNLVEPFEERYTIECEQCPKGPHEVMNAFEMKEERAEWMLEHRKQTGHLVYSEYDVRRVQVTVRADDIVL